MPLLEVEGLHVRYGGVQAVDGVIVGVGPGEVEAVLGANGAGKTSTLRAIAGQVRQTAGTIRWDGHDISRWPSFKIARAGLVLVPEGRRVFGRINVLENLLLGAYTNRSKARRTEVLEQVYAMFPVLFQRQRQAAGLLSGGEQQMLAFGRAMMAQPKVILLDEPSMGLSPLMVDTIMDSIERIASTGIGVLMVEQNAMAALRVAKRAVVLERGRIVLTGSAEEIRTHPDVVKAFLGDRASAA